MAHNIKVGDNYEVFGFSDDLRQEVFRVIEEKLGWEFAQFAEDVLTVSADKIVDGLNDVIGQCEFFDSETDDIEEVLHDIRTTAEYIKEDLADFY